MKSKELKELIKLNNEDLINLVMELQRYILTKEDKLAYNTNQLVQAERRFERTKSCMIEYMHESINIFVTKTERASRQMQHQLGSRVERVNKVIK
jgi:hypothetical protein